MLVENNFLNIYNTRNLHKLDSGMDFENILKSTQMAHKKETLSINNTNIPLSTLNQISPKIHNIEKQNNDIFTDLLNQNNNIERSEKYLGYSIDENGYMGVDFLKAAGLPSNFKIRADSLESIQKYYTEPDYEYAETINSMKYHAKKENPKVSIGKYLDPNETILYDKIDIAEIVKLAYNEISKLGDFTKDYYNSNDIKNNFPAGVAYDQGKLMNIYKNDTDLEKAIIANDKLLSFSLSNGARETFMNNDSINKYFDISKYSNGNNEIKKEGLLLNFMISQNMISGSENAEKSKWAKYFEKEDYVYHGGNPKSNFYALKNGEISTKDFVSNLSRCNAWVYYKFMHNLPNITERNYNRDDFIKWLDSEYNIIEQASKNTSFIDSFSNELQKYIL